MIAVVGLDAGPLVQGPRIEIVAELDDAW